MGELAQEKKTTQTKEVRAIPVKLEVRANEGDDSKRTITGAIKYDTDSADMRDWYGDTIVEQISAGAFTDSLAARQVVGLWSHDTSQVLGNTKSGTLRVMDSLKELRFELDIPNTTVGNDAWELIQRGDVDGVSFGMRVTKDKWSSEKRDDKRIYKRLILNAELYEISPVAFPAYPANEVSARSLDDFKASEKRAADQYEKEKMLIELDLIG
ncbi:peptidase U35 [Brevibacillus formosus]|uniref:Peptidase U35 n=1 Tax=Brevibacillus formosus TaxID=54913 RepID=A0A220MHY2_9BACL|nr:HK97 family phage prohead protease [Brevibacillus formosus]ASJ54210.1 peptidase U35 [Brevibacillus formosus]